MRRSAKGLWTNMIQPIQVIVGILLFIGTINIFSSTFVEDQAEQGNAYYHITRHLIWLAVGLPTMIFLAKYDYRKFRDILPKLMWITMVLLALVPLIGIEVNGARRWLNLGITFQPSEPAKLVGVAAAAMGLTEMIRQGIPISFFSKELFRYLWPVAAMVGLVMLQPDMGTSIVILGVPILMTFVSGVPWREIKITAPVLVGLGVLAVWLEPYRMARVVSYIDPWAYEQTLGYQSVQGFIAIGSGGFWGQGIGSGSSKFFYLPEVHTDFAFAVFSQEWGFPGVVLLLTLFAAFVYYGLETSRYAPDIYGSLLAMGLTVLIGGQGLFNIAMVCGLLPVTGIPLPFISYGGTALLVNMAAAGILMNVARKSSQHKRFHAMSGKTWS